MGDHGRSTRRYRTIAAVLTLMVAPAAAQPSSPFRDLVPDVAARVTQLLPSGSALSLTLVAADDRVDAASTRADLAAQLATRGFRVVPVASGVPLVAISCQVNLRERACLIDVRSAVPAIALVTRPHEEPRDNGPIPLALEMRPVFSQRAAVLDVVTAGDRLVVLDAAGLALYQPTNPGWRRVWSHEVASSSAWPRDLRGRLRVDGDRLEAFLPGVTCRGTVAADVRCAASREPWPIGIDNTGLDPARNVFSTPEGLAFFSAAPLDRDAGAQWLVGTGDGVLALLDAASGRLPTPRAGDDVAGLRNACTELRYVVARSPMTAGGDALLLFQVSDRRLVPAASPLVLPGVLTALWSTAGATVATAITHDAAAHRYDAFQISIACVR